MNHTIEVTPHALIVRKPFTVDAMPAIVDLAKSYGFDLLAAGSCRPLGATLVITSAEHQPALEEAIRAAARETAAGDVLKEWLEGPDTGTSSLTIAGVLAGMPTGGWNAPPSDPSDFGRCRRLLALMPGWRDRLPEVAVAHPDWAPFVLAWDELDALFLKEEPTGRAPELYERMHRLSRAYREDRARATDETLALAKMQQVEPDRKAMLVEGWTMPTGTCSDCGVDLQPAVYVDGYGDCVEICLSLDCPDECGDGVEVPWPFEEDTALTSEVVALGFRESF